MRALWCNLKTQMRVLALMLGSMFLVLLFFAVYFSWLDTGGGNRTVLSYIAVILFYCAMLGFMQLSGVYAKTALSMGSTRGNIFWSRQISKAVFSTAVPALFLLFLELTRLAGLTQEKTALSARMYIAIICALLFMATAGSVFGIAMQRFGRFGVVLFVIVCALMGMVFGLTPMLLTMVRDNTFGIGSFFERWLDYLALGILAAAALLTALEARLARRFTA